MTDWTLQMAFSNFSGALMHVGGQNVYYNVSLTQTIFVQTTLIKQPFTPPPSTYSSLYEWTTGSVYYPTLIIAEAFGKSGKARVVDLYADNANIFHPAYAVYEDDTPTRFVLFNYVDDSTGASNMDVTINLAGGTPMTNVSVRYFSASSVSEQYDIKWAGQTMGNSFSSDGRLYGDVETISVQCTDGNCVIPVPAPSIAIVYLDPEALADSSVPVEAVQSYSTTVIGEGDATIAPGALETGNGLDPNLIGSTSKGSRGSDNAAGERVDRIGSAMWAFAGLTALLIAAF